MPTNQYDAHKQWVSQPPDERFPNLESRLPLFLKDLERDI